MGKALPPGRAPAQPVRGELHFQRYIPRRACPPKAAGGAGYIRLVFRRKTISFPTTPIIPTAPTTPIQKFPHRKFPKYKRRPHNYKAPTFTYHLPLFLLEIERSFCYIIYELPFYN